jgi:hypothetical protein
LSFQILDFFEKSGIYLFVNDLGMLYTKNDLESNSQKEQLLAVYSIQYTHNWDLPLNPLNVLGGNRRAIHLNNFGIFLKLEVTRNCYYPL